MTVSIQRRLPAVVLLPLLLAPAGRAAAADKATAARVVHTANGTTEVGTIDGTPYRIDVPDGWNHELIVFYHGYAEHPLSFHIADHVIAPQQPFLDRHFAIAQSAYSQTGWALKEAYPETEALRRYFSKAYGAPRETYAVGFSMGGLLVSITLELNAKPYAGGLDFCGAVGPTSEAFEKRFAMRAAFDHYFPGLLPPLLNTPPFFDDSPAQVEKLLAALRGAPAAAAAMRGLMGLHTDADVAHDISYYTYVIGDLQRRAGGNPFDNRNYIYTGASSTSSAADYELNDKVHRYAATPQARAYLTRHYSPNGHLGRPMLALHTVYDPIVLVPSIALYNHRVEAAGDPQNLVQQYVDREGHCNFTLEQIGGAFDELLVWTRDGVRPTPGRLPEPVALHVTVP
jgi:hypothetical protein